MPDNIKKVKDLEGIKVDQVGIGSCTNSSLADMLLTAEVLKGKKSLFRQVQGKSLQCFHIQMHYLISLKVVLEFLKLDKKNN
ncbi:MAG: hypothetical protein LBB92_02085 [Endomicrobium sp.]|jgi:hypothetical protein|nr:hypothetical protein [Endomicrobium sp.]